MGKRSGEKVLTWLLRVGTWKIRKSIRDNNIRVLIDNSTFQYGRTHETILDKQVVHWPPESDPSEVEMLRQVPKYYKESEKKVWDNLVYLPAIAYLARTEPFLFTSRELLNELNHQQIGRSRGRIGWCDYNLFEGIEIPSIDGYDAIEFDLEYFSRNPTFNGIISSTDIDPFGTYPDNQEKMNERISESTDPLYKGLVTLLPKRMNFDAHHISTAEKYGLFCFLTMDFRLHEHMKRLENKEPIASLQTKVMTPEEFGKYWGLPPVDPYRKIH